jgi:thiosulfate dehydrogenase
MLMLTFMLVATGCEDEEEMSYVEENYDSADAVRGGLLYDKWWKVTGATEPTTDHPQWAMQTSNTRDGSTTWRCKECHGWDYKGQDGAYNSNNSHYTGFDGVYSARNMDMEELFDNIGSGTNHSFGDVMDDADVLDLTKFVLTGLIDMGQHINLSTKAVTGDTTTGMALYNAAADGNCAACHGSDGKSRNFGDDTEPVYVGTLADDNPWETLHKIRWGHPGSVMTSAVELGLTDQETVDILAYTQTLPTE